MCGIVGYVGNQVASQILLEGLARLEYRGYDSSGIATLSCEVPEQGFSTHIKRSSGKLECLRNLIGAEDCPGNIGIGHTRWATHGKPTDANAHPHRSGSITLVHNGIIENQYELREVLRKRGRHFHSETDSELIAHLIDIARNEEQLPFRQAVLSSIQQLKGAYALAIVDDKSPGQIICVKQSCPLVIALGEGQNFIASDYTAALPYTKKFIILEDGDLAEVEKDGVQFFSTEGTPVERKETILDWSPTVAEKEGHKHFMHKEIFDQPRALVDTLRGRYDASKGCFNLGEVNTSALQDIQRICIVACGSSYYAGLIGKYLLEQVAKIPVEVDLASEFRYRDALVDSNTLVLGISQSGETADTLAALKFSADKGAKLLSICNVVGSAVPRLCSNTGGTLYTRAGPEISVASTKAFVAQLMALNILALHFALERGAMTQGSVRELVEDLVRLGPLVEKQLKSEGALREIAQEFLKNTSMLFLGRGLGFPIAFEGALKMKEISYIHAEGFAAGELKHGPIALIEPEVPTIVVALSGTHFEKVISNMQEVKSRGGKLIAVTDEPCEQLNDLCEHVIEIPKASHLSSPILAAVPLQLLAYHVADLRGLDVDQPRNLAKSVTVE